MLAKVTGNGKGFSGKIDYLYEGKESGRKAEEKGATIISYSDNIRIPNNYLDKKGIARMKEDFINQAMSNKNYGGDEKTKFVGEHMISFTKDDLKKLDKDKIKAITEEYVKLAGIDKTQYVAISHKDTDNYHIHILFNRGMNDGTMYKNWKEKNKTIERGVALSLKHNFTLVKNLHKVALTKEVVELRASMSDIKELKQSDKLIGKARNLLHLEKLCEKENISFSHDKLVNRVQVNGKEYHESDLKAVFLLNRKESEHGKELKEEKTKNAAFEQSNSNVKSMSENHGDKVKQGVSLSDENGKKRRKPKREADWKLKRNKIVDNKKYLKL